MMAPWKVPLKDRVRYCRLITWAGVAIRERRLGVLLWILRHPRDWFRYGSGLDCG